MCGSAAPVHGSTTSTALLIAPAGAVALTVPDLLEEIMPVDEQMFHGYEHLKCTQLVGVGLAETTTAAATAATAAAAAATTTATTTATTAMIVTVIVAVAVAVFVPVAMSFSLSLFVGAANPPCSSFIHSHSRSPDSLLPHVSSVQVFVLLPQLQLLY